MKQLRYILEALLLYMFYGICKTLTVDSASGFGGWLARSIGPHLAASRKGLRNLQACYPDNSAARNKAIIKDVWNNLGRTLAEYPHLKTIGATRVTLKNKEILDEIFSTKTPAIFVGAHIANWEVMTATALMQLGHIVEATYRAPNNPYVRNLLEKSRSIGGRIPSHPKEASSARTTLKTLKSGGCIGILADQKYNEGIETQFFGRPAMTNAIFATLAQKTDALIVPIQVIRTGGAHFEMIAIDPIDPNLSIEETTQAITNHVEQWVRENPGQWIWLHRRWKT